MHRARIGTHRVTLLIPAKNEERNLAWVLDRVPPLVDEIVLIDGHSTDRTIEVARALRPDIVVVPEMGPGKGAAVRTGLAHATGDFVVMIDADGSMDPGDIQLYVTELEGGADLVKGSRFVPGGGTTDMTFLRKAGNRVLLACVNKLFGSDFTELCYGFMAFRRDAMQALELTSDGFEIETEIVVRSVLHGLDVREVASFEAPRRFGESNLNTFRDGARVLRTILFQRATWGPSGRVQEPGLVATFSRDLPTLAAAVAEPAHDDVEEREAVVA